MANSHPQNPRLTPLQWLQANASLDRSSSPAPLVPQEQPLVNRTQPLPKTQARNQLNQQALERRGKGLE